MKGAPSDGLVPAVVLNVSPIAPATPPGPYPDTTIDFQLVEHRLAMTTRRNLLKFLRRTTWMTAVLWLLVAAGPTASAGQPCCETVVSSSQIVGQHVGPCVEPCGTHSTIHYVDPCGDASGVWRGQWFSHPTGHRGPVNATIRRVSPDCYEATFYGRFFVLFPFAYRATLHRVPGTADLYESAKRMPLVGTYRMTARISGNHFEANFMSGKDSGVFRMTRVR